MILPTVEELALAMSDADADHGIENVATRRQIALASHDPLGYQNLARAVLALLTGPSAADATTGTGA